MITVTTESRMSKPVRWDWTWDFIERIERYDVHKYWTLLSC